jgi:hypothetical protein
MQTEVRDERFAELDMLLAHQWPNRGGRPRKNFNSAVSMYRSGLSIARVALAFGVSRQSMWETLTLRGVQFRKPGFPSPTQERER